ncbi:ArgC Acetylglutamate semialdehyde dehydrogenase [Flavobacteriaceae bacterium]
MISIGIIGGSGYTAGELIRLLIHHSKVNIDFVYSTTNAGKPISSVHQDLLGDSNLVFTDAINPNVNLVFLCLGHGKSKAFLSDNQFDKNTKIIDLGNDFRLLNDAKFQDKTFIYGLPELNKSEIKSADCIANPGCFATAIQLALLPLAAANELQNSIHINATTGSTGAGVQPSATTHNSWRNNNMSHYKSFEHQHLGEIHRNLSAIQNDFDQEVLLIPNRGDFTRGIFATIYTKTALSLENCLKIFEEFYKNQPFVVVTTSEINLKQVVQTNKCIISIEKKGDYVLITSIIDNLLKGASGQAIQNMNLMFGFDETEGIVLKSSGF